MIWKYNIKLLLLRIIDRKIFYKLGLFFDKKSSRRTECRNYQIFIIFAYIKFFTNYKKREKQASHLPCLQSIQNIKEAIIHNEN